MSANIKTRGVTLEALPAEVRNLIYSFAIVEDEPLVVYRATRYRRRTSTGSGSRIVHEYHYLPERPALAAINRGMRKEVLSIFYGANTFLFNYREDQVKLVLPWSLYTQRIDAGLTRNLDRITNIILEFDLIVELSRTSFVMGTAEIHFELGKFKHLKITYGGTMRELCACESGKSLRRFMYMAPGSKAVLGGAVAFEKHYLTGLRGHVLLTRDELCAKCARRVAHLEAEEG